MAAAPNPQTTGAERAAKRIAEKRRGEGLRLQRVASLAPSRQSRRRQALKLRKEEVARSHKAAVKARKKGRGAKINDRYAASPTGAKPVNRAHNLVTKLRRAARNAAPKAEAA